MSADKTIGSGRYNVTQKGKFRFIVTNPQTGEEWERASLAGAERLVRQLEAWDDANAQPKVD